MATGDYRAHNEKLHDLISRMRDALAPLSRTARDVNWFVPPKPAPPYLVFEVLDASVRAGGGAPPRRFFKAHVYHGRDWTLDDLKRLQLNADILNARSVVATLTEIQNDPTQLGQLLQRYEKKEIDVDYKASGVLWQAWCWGKLRFPVIQKYLGALYMEFPFRYAKDIVEILREEFDVGKDEKSIGEPREDEDCIEWSLIHGVLLPKTASDGTGMYLLVHYPLILQNFWFVGFAYFIARRDKSTDPPPLFDRQKYPECLSEFRSQHDTLDEFLKERALNILEDKRTGIVYEERRGLFLDVAQSYFACFDVKPTDRVEVGAEILAEIDEVAVCMPKEWVKSPQVVDKLEGAKWREYADEKLKNLHREVMARIPGWLCLAFSECFGSRGVKQITHNGGGYWHTAADALRVEVQRQARTLQACLANERSIPFLDRVPDVWRSEVSVPTKVFVDLCEQLAPEYSWNTLGRHTALKELRDTHFRCKRESFIDLLNNGPGTVLESLPDDVPAYLLTKQKKVIVVQKAPEDKRKEGRREGFSAFEIFLPLHKFLEGPFRTLIESIPSRAQTNQAELLIRAVRTEDERSPEGFREALFQNFIIIRHAGERVQPDDLQAGTTDCSKAFADMQLGAIGRYLLICRNDNGGWRSKDFTPGSSFSVVPLDDAPLPNLIKELIKDDQANLTYHLILFPTWRSCER